MRNCKGRNALAPPPSSEPARASEKGNAPDAKNRINRHHNDIGHSTSTIMGSAIVASYKGSTTILVMGIPTLR